jgi:ceramide glucosyltransferase
MHGARLAARHELVLQSDANVRLPPGHLRRIVGELEATRASLLGCLVVGAGERSPGATLENLQLTAFTAPGLCMAKELANITCILGKAMLFSKQDLEDVGGLERVKDVLAEDFVLAQAFAQAGKRVVLSTATVTNVNVGTSLDRFLARHSRWMKMRAVISVPGMAGDLGSNPLPFALGALFASSFDLRVLAVVVAVWLYKSAWDHRLLLLLRGHGMGRSQLWASPARDLALTLVWAYSVFSRTTEWRGRRFRLGRGSTLTPLPAAGTGSADQQATATATESPR